jgi:hypothetical protein
MGVGDELMALGDAYRLRVKRSVPVAIGNGEWSVPSPVYDNIPWLYHNKLPKPAGLEWVLSYPGHRPYCDYELMISTARERYGRVTDWRHAFRLLGRKYWRSDYHATPAPVVLTLAERRAGAAVLPKRDKPVVVLGPSIKMGAARNKAWPLDRYQAVVNARADQINFVEFGQVVKGTIPLKPRSFRHALAVLSHCYGYLGNEGGLHHGAAAVGKPAVVIFGGYINPLVTGYNFHQNLYVECEDEGCPGPTPAGEAALAAITVERVIAALDLMVKS